MSQTPPPRSAFNWFRYMLTEGGLGIVGSPSFEYQNLVEDHRLSCACTIRTQYPAFLSPTTDSAHSGRNDGRQTKMAFSSCIQAGASDRASRSAAPRRLSANSCS